MIIAWFASKIIFYGVMVALAIPIVRLYVRDLRGFIVSYTLLRVGFAVLAGFLILFAGKQLGESAGPVLGYLLTFGVVRYVEWFALLAVIGHNYDVGIVESGWRGQLWILIGVGGNMLLDLAAVKLVMPTIKFYC